MSQYDFFTPWLYEKHNIHSNRWIEACLFKLCETCMGPWGRQWKDDRAPSPEMILVYHELLIQTHLPCFHKHPPLFTIIETLQLVTYFVNLLGEGIVVHLGWIGWLGWLDQTCGSMRSPLQDCKRGRDRVQVRSWPYVLTRHSGSSVACSRVMIRLGMTKRIRSRLAPGDNRRRIRYVQILASHIDLNRETAVRTTQAITTIHPKNDLRFI